MHARSWRGADGAGRRTKTRSEGRVRRRVYGMHFVRGRLISKCGDIQPHGQTYACVWSDRQLANITSSFIMRPNGPDKIRVV